MKKICTIALLCCAIQTQLFAWQPAGDKIKTRWAKDVTPENVWKSYPRPQLERADWVNLNGLWSYAVTDQQTSKNSVKFEGEILVPFAIESSLSGVQKTFLPEDKLWYKRNFTIAKEWAKKNVILHFGAVDYECSVWINGKFVGSHKGGNNPFSFDITKYLNKSGDQTVELSVVDPTDTRSVTRGKQRLNPSGIWYTPVSGIWQTVWIEAVNDTYIKQVLPHTDIDKMVVCLDFDIDGSRGDEDVKIEVKNGDNIIKRVEQKLSDDIHIDMKGAILWSPNSPKLYDMNITLSRKGKVIDEVSSYFAMRKISVDRDECGYKRVFLNNKPIFQYGPLDQGWWPDGLLTPPTEEAMLFDMVELKKMGFNTIRKHIKVEPEQYYYYADSLGLMLWQDMVSGFKTAPKTAQKGSQNNNLSWKATEEFQTQWSSELFEMIDRLRFYPSITSWVIFNEGWGQHNTVEIVTKVMDYDKSRVTNGVTGWSDKGVGHTYDIHNYPMTSMILPKNNGDRISSLGEFGGFGWAVDGHLWNIGKNNWGYKKMDGATALMDSYGRILYDLETLVAQGLAGAIYTQTTDVEGEVNGLITYDREVVKLPSDLLHIMQSRLYEVKPANATILINDSQNGGINKKMISINGSPLKSAKFPLAIEAKSKVVSEVTFNSDKEYQYLSFWTKMSGDVTVWLNGVKIMNQDVKQRSHYNQHNLSDYSRCLNVGENKLRVELKGTTHMKFDYGLRAY